MQQKNENQEILTVDELAARLRVDRRTVIDDANAGKIPSYKSGARGQWRFYWPAVEKALGEKRQ